MQNYLFELKEGFFISLMAIRANKVRAILTAIGIVIGIWAVTTMSTAIKGIDVAFQKGVSSLGSDNLYVHKFPWFSNQDFHFFRNRPNITMEDYEKFKSLAQLPEAVAPSALAFETIKREDKVVDRVIITGTSNEYISTTNLDFQEGRFFNSIEDVGGRRVAIIGFEIAEKLFPMGQAVNKDIKISGVRFTIIGVLSKQGSWVMGPFNPDNQVYIPIEALFKNFMNDHFSSITINVKAPNNAMIQDVKDETLSIMRRIRGLKYNQPDDFAINQQEALLDVINSTVGVIQIAGLFITGLALFVGAIGIMNIMFVSVKERTREIGIRKAIGAKKAAILRQFITEAIFICMIGGLIGLIVTSLTTMYITQFLPDAAVQIDTVILAIVISLLTGVASGFAPAYTAAKLDPVEALRYE